MNAAYPFPQEQMNLEQRSGYWVEAVSAKQAEPFILNLHYAHRWPSVSYLFGLHRDGQLVGVVSYGTPPSSPLRKGVAGPAFESSVLELNRLCLLENRKNEASRLVGGSLKMLNGNRIIVSFADPSHGHRGTVYQAANFHYCGLSEQRTDWKIKGMEHLHGVTVADLSRNQPDRAGYMRKTYGEKFYSEPRPRKHRYIKITGTRAFKREAFAALRYRPMPYPKPADGLQEKTPANQSGSVGSTPTLRLTTSDEPSSLRLATHRGSST